MSRDDGEAEIEQVPEGGESLVAEAGHADGDDEPETDSDEDPSASASGGDAQPASKAPTVSKRAVALSPSRDLGPVSALSRYMAELRHHAPISREEEHELAVRWREDGDVEAARQLVLANLRLVVKIAMEYRRAWTNTLDLIQEGNVGLAEAVQRFDPYQGVKLSSYAVYWIRAFLLKYILDNMRSVRMGTTRAQRKLFFRLNKERRELERQGFQAEPALIAERLDVTEDDVIDMQYRLATPDLSFDAPARRDDSGSTTYGDLYSAGGATAEERVGDQELHVVFMERINEFEQGLGERDRRILRERVLAEEPRTLADMGEEFGVSRERVRQLEARIVNDLRAYMKANMVDFEYYAPPAKS